MGLKIYQNGKFHDVDDIQLAEKIVSTKANKDPWAVIDELVKAWGDRAPDEEKMLRVQIEDHKSELADKEFGQTTGGKELERRFTMVFPMNLMLMIRTQYKATELPMDDAFYKEFLRRYPMFQVADKL